jgi:hypothetical protein
MNYSRIRQSFCRGKALPRKSINFQIILIWQCFAQTSQRRDKLSMKAQRSFQNDCGEYKNSGANAQPLQVCVYRAWLKSY